MHKKKKVLVDLGLSRKAAEMLLILIDHSGWCSQRDIILAGVMQPYISIASKELARWGFIQIQENKKERGRPYKLYRAKSIEDIKSIFRSKLDKRHDNALEALATSL